MNKEDRSKTTRRLRSKCGAPPLIHMFCNQDRLFVVAHFREPPITTAPIIFPNPTALPGLSHSSPRSSVTVSSGMAAFVQSSFAGRSLLELARTRGHICRCRPRYRIPLDAMGNSLAPAALCSEISCRAARERSQHEPNDRFISLASEQREGRATVAPGAAKVQRNR